MAISLAVLTDSAPTTAAPLRDGRAGLDANADQPQIGIDRVVSAEPDGIRRRSRDGRAKDDRHTMAAAVGRDEVADKWRECPSQQTRFALDHRDTTSIIG